MRAAVIGHTGQIGTIITAKVGDYVGDKPDAVIYAAAMTNVNLCETAPIAAFDANCISPVATAQRCARMGIPFVIFSSDYVFDGKHGPYRENAAPAPLNVYGWTKLCMEREVRKAYPEACIIRTTNVYGVDPKQKNFLYQVLRSDQVTASITEMTTPTFNEDVAQAAILAVEHKLSGIYHVAGPQSMSRLYFASVIHEVFGLTSQLAEGKRDSQSAKRPEWGGLVSTQPILNTRSVHEGLKLCRERIRQAVGTDPVPTLASPAGAQ